MILIEGCDNSGKTTLVSKLSDDLRLLSIRQRQLPRNKLDITEYVLYMLGLSRRFPTIFDRWPPISEPIYGPICRGVSFLTKQEVFDLHSMITELDPCPVIVYCRPRDSVILDFGEREQMEGVRENGRKLIKAYDKSMNETPLDVITYDYEHDSYETLLKQLKVYL